MTVRAPLQLRTGNPSDKETPASYTRFTLPFAYRLTPTSADGECLRWERTHPAETYGRKEYFTRETAAVLFERAAWFALEKHGNAFGESFDVSLDGGLKTVRMNPPRIVLFEIPRGAEDAKKRDIFVLQTGFLVLELFFDSTEGGGKPTLDDLLELNEVFRYKKPRFEGHESVARNLLPHASVDALFCSETTAVEDVGGSERRPLLYDYWEFLLRKPLRLGADEYYSLLSGEWDEWDVYADKRAFVWTCAVMDGGGGALRERFFAPSSDKWEAHNYGHWVKLLNVDYSAGETSRHAATDFEREWARERTYHRWEQRGTFYGFSYHSGAALMPAETDPPVWRHWGTTYFDILLLLFYLRVTSFRFSNLLTDISSLGREGVRKPKEIERWCNEFERLRWEFTLFTNLYQFPLVSNQEQGLEMYTLARKCLDVDDLYDEIRSEIQNSHEFLQQKQQDVQNDRIMRLTWVATIGLSMSITLAFIGTDFGRGRFAALSGWLGRYWPFVSSHPYLGIEWLTLALFSLFSFAAVFAAGYGLFYLRARRKGSK